MQPDTLTGRGRQQQFYLARMMATGLNVVGVDGGILDCALVGLGGNVVLNRSFGCFPEGKHSLKKLNRARSSAKKNLAKKFKARFLALDSVQHSRLGQLRCVASARHKYLQQFSTVPTPEHTTNRFQRYYQNPYSPQAYGPSEWYQHGQDPPPYMVKPDRTWRCPPAGTSDMRLR